MSLKPCHSPITSPPSPLPPPTGSIFAVLHVAAAVGSRRSWVRTEKEQARCAGLLALRAGFNTVYIAPVYWCGNVHNPGTQVFILATSYAVINDLNRTHRDRTRSFPPPPPSIALHCTINIYDGFFFYSQVFIFFFYIFTVRYIQKITNGFVLFR